MNALMHGVPLTYSEIAFEMTADEWQMAR